MFEVHVMSPSCWLFLEKVFLLPRVAKLGFGTSPSSYKDIKG
jgi:hypothetical protein